MAINVGTTNVISGGSSQGSSGDSRTELKHLHFITNISDFGDNAYIFKSSNRAEWLDFIVNCKEVYSYEVAKNYFYNHLSDEDVDYFFENSEIVGECLNARCGEERYNPGNTDDVISTITSESFNLLESKFKEGLKRYISIKTEGETAGKWIGTVFNDSELKKKTTMSSILSDTLLWREVSKNESLIFLIAHSSSASKFSSTSSISDEVYNSFIKNLCKNEDNMKNFFKKLDTDGRLQEFFNNSERCSSVITSDSAFSALVKNINAFEALLSSPSSDIAINSSEEIKEKIYTVLKDNIVYEKVMRETSVSLENLKESNDSVKNLLNLSNESKNLISVTDSLLSEASYQKELVLEVSAKVAQMLNSVLNKNSLLLYVSKKTDVFKEFLGQEFTRKTVCNNPNSITLIISNEDSLVNFSYNPEAIEEMMSSSSIPEGLKVKALINCIKDFKGEFSTFAELKEDTHFKAELEKNELLTRLCCAVYPIIKIFTSDSSFNDSVVSNLLEVLKFNEVFRKQVKNNKTLLKELVKNLRDNRIFESRIYDDIVLTEEYENVVYEYGNEYSICLFLSAKFPQIASNVKSGSSTYKRSFPSSISSFSSFFNFDVENAFNFGTDPGTFFIQLMNENSVLFNKVLKYTSVSNILNIISIFLERVQQKGNRFFQRLNSYVIRIISEFVIKLIRFISKNPKKETIVSLCRFLNIYFKIITPYSTSYAYTFGGSFTENFLQSASDKLFSVLNEEILKSNPFEKILIKEYLAFLYNTSNMSQLTNQTPFNELTEKITTFEDLSKIKRIISNHIIDRLSSISSYDWGWIVCLEVFINNVFLNNLKYIFSNSVKMVRNSDNSSVVSIVDQLSTYGGSYGYLYLPTSFLKKVFFSDYFLEKSFSVLKPKTENSNYLNNLIQENYSLYTKDVFGANSYIVPANQSHSDSSSYFNTHGSEIINSDLAMGHLIKLKNSSSNSKFYISTQSTLLKNLKKYIKLDSLGIQDFIKSISDEKNRQVIYSNRFLNLEALVFSMEQITSVNAFLNDSQSQKWVLEFFRKNKKLINEVQKNFDDCTLKTFTALVNNSEIDFNENFDLFEIFFSSSPFTYSTLLSNNSISDVAKRNLCANEIAERFNFNKPHPCTYLPYKTGFFEDPLQIILNSNQLTYLVNNLIMLISNNFYSGSQQFFSILKSASSLSSYMDYKVVFKCLPLLNEGLNDTYGMGSTLSHYIGNNINFTTLLSKTHYSTRFLLTTKSIPINGNYYSRTELCCRMATKVASFSENFTTISGLLQNPSAKSTILTNEISLKLLISYVTFERMESDFYSFFSEEEKTTIINRVLGISTTFGSFRTNHNEMRAIVSDDYGLKLLNTGESFVPESNIITVVKHLAGISGNSFNSIEDLFRLQENKFKVLKDKDCLKYLFVVASDEVLRKLDLFSEDTLREINYLPRISEVIAKNIKRVLRIISPEEFKNLFKLYYFPEALLYLWDIDNESLFKVALNIDRKLIIDTLFSEENVDFSLDLLGENANLVDILIKDSLDCFRNKNFLTSISHSRKFMNILRNKNFGVNLHPNGSLLLKNNISQVFKGIKKNEVITVTNNSTPQGLIHPFKSQEGIIFLQVCKANNNSKYFTMKTSKHVSPYGSFSNNDHKTHNTVNEVLNGNEVNYSKPLMVDYLTSFKTDYSVTLQGDSSGEQSKVCYEIFLFDDFFLKED